MTEFKTKPESRQDPEDALPVPVATARRQARQRLREDRRRYPENLGPIFDVLAARLFEPGFNAKTVIPDRAARRRFRLAVGVTLRTYRDRQLLRVALELVRETALPILEIAAGLGFDDPELFRKWFQWRTGKAPMAMRSPEGEAPDHDPDPPADATGDEVPWTDRECRQAAAWDVSPRRGAELCRKIRELYPEVDDPPLSD